MNTIKEPVLGQTRALMGLLGVHHAAPTTDERDLAMCVEGLVLNSVAAGARTVDIAIAPGTELRIRDNGEGIRDVDNFPGESFRRVATRMGGHMSTVRLDTSTRFARHRASLNLATRSLVGHTVTERTRDSRERPKTGTEITIAPLVIALPANTSAAELEQRLQSAHPGVAFTVTSEATG